MAATNTAVTRFASVLSSFQNGFSGHTKARARLNAVASYDQSNELYMVCDSVFPMGHVSYLFAQGFFE